MNASNLGPIIFAPNKISVRGCSLFRVSFDVFRKSRVHNFGNLAISIYCDMLDRFHNIHIYVQAGLCDVLSNHAEDTRVLSLYAYSPYTDRQIALSNSVFSIASGAKMMENLTFKNSCSNGHATVGYNGDDCPVCEEMANYGNLADEANRLARERDDGWRD